MDLPSFLIGLLPLVAVGFVCVVAFRRRHHRRGSSPLIVNPYTLAVEPDTAVHGHLPFVQPAPATTTSLPIDTPPVGPGSRNTDARSVNAAASARPSTKA